jgi:outer membrane protein assembly factor BamB
MKQRTHPFSRNRLLVLLALFLCASPTLQASDWPQWRGPKRDGISTESGWLAQWPKEGPKQVWKTNVGTGCASVVVAGGRVYAIGNKSDTDTVSCLDTATGKEVWHFSYPAPLDPNMYEGGPNTTPTVDGSFVYTVGRKGQLFCLSAEKGEVVWSKDYQRDFGAQAPQWGYSGTPLIVGNLLIADVGGNGASAVAFEKTTGKEMWKQGSDKAGYSSPVVFELGGKQCVAIFNASGLVVREVATGKEVLRHQWKTSYDVNAATPIIQGDRILIASGYSKGGALLQMAGGDAKVLWQSKSMRSKFSSPILWKGHLYGFDESTLACLDFATGDVKWTQSGLGMGTVLIADGKLIVLSESGELVTADAVPTAFTPISRAKVIRGRCWVVPVLANGRIYAKNNEGELVCLDVSGK